MGRGRGGRSLRVLDGCTITGDVQVADARLFRGWGHSFDGDLQTITPGESPAG